MISINQFATQMAEAVSSRLGPEYKVKIDRMRGNNSLLGTALFISRRHDNFTTGLPLDEFHQYYNQMRDAGESVSVDFLADYLLKGFKDKIQGSMNWSKTFNDFKSVKDRICFRIINSDRNSKILEDLPYKSFLDLAVTFFIYTGDTAGEDGAADTTDAVENDMFRSAAIIWNDLMNHMMDDMVNDTMATLSDDERVAKARMSVPINRKLARTWRVNADDLFNLAIINTPRLYPLAMSGAFRGIPILHSSSDQVSDHQADVDAETDEQHNDTSVCVIATNKTAWDGAAIMLYPGFLAALSEKFKEAAELTDTIARNDGIDMGDETCDGAGDFYILPFNVHRLIIVPKYTYSGSVSDLKKMIFESNVMDARVEDILSDHVYVYDSGAGEMRIC